MRLLEACAILKAGRKNVKSYNYSEIPMNAPRHSEQLALFFKPKKGVSTLTDTPKHIEGFTNLVKYLVRLRRDGTLDDHDFGELIRIASASFIESELNEKIDKVLENHIPHNVFLGLWK